MKKAEHQRIDAFELWCWKRLLALKSLLDCKEIKPVNLKGNQPWIFIRRTAAEAEASNTRWEELTHWKRPWFWERLKAEERDNRGWDCWMVSLTQWTGVWARSGRWRRIGKPGVLQPMRSQRDGHNWATEHQKQIFYCLFKCEVSFLELLEGCWPGLPVQGE